MNRIYLILFLIGNLFLWPLTTYAASIDIVSTYNVTDSAAQNGDILVSTAQGLVRATPSTVFHLFGVLENNPLVVYKSVNDSGIPVARTGVATVNVTTENGNINEGDYITVSDLPGKGDKALTSGYIIGVALQNFTFHDGVPTSVNGQNIAMGKIRVALGVEYAEINTPQSFQRLLDYLSAAVFKNVQNPDKFTQLIRYIGAGLIIVVAFLVSFMTFSRSVSKGVEAIGRNPLAKSTIQFSIIISTLLTIAIALIGLIASFILLKL